MGGCCTCLKYPPAARNPAGVSEEHVPQSSRQVSPPAVSGGLLNDTTSEEHVPQSSRQVSTHAVSGGPLNDTTRRQTLASFLPTIALGVTQEISGDQTNTSRQTRGSTSTEKTVAGDNYKTGTSSKSLQTRGSTSTQETVAGDNHKTGTSSKSEKLKESECKAQTALKLGSAKDSEIELAKLGKAVILEKEEDENVCPICFIEYDEENPQIFTNCGHHFHHECIHDWMKRRRLCPVCNQDEPFNSPSH